MFYTYKEGFDFVLGSSCRLVYPQESSLLLLVIFYLIFNYLSSGVFGTKIWA